MADPALSPWLKWPADSALQADFLSQHQALLAQVGIPPAPVRVAAKKDAKRKKKDEPKKESKVSCGMLGCDCACTAPTTVHPSIPALNLESIIQGSQFEGLLCMPLTGADPKEDSLRFFHLRQPLGFWCLRPGLFVARQL